eukprot:403370837
MIFENGQNYVIFNNQIYKTLLQQQAQYLKNVQGVMRDQIYIRQSFRNVKSIHIGKLAKGMKQHLSLTNYADIHKEDTISCGLQFPQTQKDYDYLYAEKANHVRCQMRKLPKHMQIFKLALVHIDRCDDHNLTTLA